MGTSSNHPSPSIPAWLPVKAVLASDRVTPERQCAEIWRAAIGDRGGQILNELGSEIVARAAEIASSSVGSVAEAVAALRNEIVANKSVGLTVDMANRALARACHLGGGRDQFSAELFAEAVSYYASRDLPSYVGASGRIDTTSASIDLKNSLRAIVRSTVENVGPAPAEQTEWRAYVRQVAETLSRGRK